MPKRNPDAGAALSCPEQGDEHGQERRRQQCGREVNDISGPCADNALEGSHDASPPRKNRSVSWPSSMERRTGSDRPASAGQPSGRSPASAMISNP